MLRLVEEQLLLEEHGSRDESEKSMVKLMDEMYTKLQEQPKDIEKLTEISEFMIGVTKQSEELRKAVEEL